MAYKDLKVSIENGWARLTANCKHCKKPRLNALVSHDQYRAWRHGDMIQDVMPTLSDNEREMCITGICGLCWKKLFGEREGRQNMSFKRFVDEVESMVGRKLEEHEIRGECWGMWNAGAWPESCDVA